VRIRCFPIRSSEEREGANETIVAYLVLVVGLAVPGLWGEERPATRPDVLFMVVDDMNDWVSVLDPTLLELCGLPGDNECDGVSIVPLLKEPEAKRERSALMTYGRGNHAVRSERWRYIRYADGSEELYDHASDPRERVNVAEKSEHAAIMEMHRKWLPVEEASRIKDLRK